MAVRELTYVKAYNEALHQVMAEDEDVFVVGEDVAGYGGVFRRSRSTGPSIVVVRGS